MPAKRFKIDIRPVLIIITVLFALVLAGLFLYKKLSEISEKMSQQNSRQIPSSLLAQQLLLELRSAENSANSFNITKDTFYQEEFNQTLETVDKLKNRLTRAKDLNETYKKFKDSILYYTNSGLHLISTLSSIELPKKVTEELNIINEKIDQTYLKREKEIPVEPEVKPEPVVPEPEPIVKEPAKDSAIKKKGFFHKIFNRKSKDKKETKVQPKPNTQEVEKEKEKEIKIEEPDLTKKQEEIIDQSKRELASKLKLKETVKQVKSSQIKQLDDYQLTEYYYSSQFLQAGEKINEFALALKKVEDQTSLAKYNQTQVEVNNIKIYSGILSIIIILLLFILAYYSFSYVRKKKQYELSLLESKARSDELAKAKETFLANMSHEIRTPLSAMHGFTEQILSGNLNPEQQKQLQIVKNSAAYLSKLVTNILTYSKIQAGKDNIDPVEVDIKSEMHEVEALFLAEAKNKKLDFQIDTSTLQNPYIIIDIYKVKQALYNLISNALKFTDAGSVKILLKQTGDDKKNRLHFTIADTGKGIAEETIPKLFNEYEQGDDSIHKEYGGTGLGLVITKKIIEQMGGTISIKSKLKQGTEVKFNIPYLDGLSQSKPETKNSEPINHFVLQNKNILIADDEAFNRLLLRSILNKYNTKTYEAQNGEEAVVMSKELAIDTIIMDLRMPIKNGIDATKEIRKFNPHIPIIGATADVNEEKISQCMQAGMSTMVFKPFTEKDLLQKIIDCVTGTGTEFRTEKQLNTVTTSSSLNLAGLNEYANEDEEFKHEMILLFHKSINQALYIINHFAQTGDLSQVSEVAHKVIPSCRHFEAHELIKILKYFETISPESMLNTTELSYMLEQINVQINSINLQLEPLMKKQTI